MSYQYQDIQAKANAINQSIQSQAQYFSDQQIVQLTTLLAQLEIVSNENVLNYNKTQLSDELEQFQISQEQIKQQKTAINNQIQKLRFYQYQYQNQLDAAEQQKEALQILQQKQGLINIYHSSVEYKLKTIEKILNTNSQKKLMIGQGKLGLNLIQDKLKELINKSENDLKAVDEQIQQYQQNSNYNYQIRYKVRELQDYKLFLERQRQKWLSEIVQVYQSIKEFESMTLNVEKEQSNYQVLLNQQQNDFDWNVDQSYRYEQQQQQIQQQISRFTPIDQLIILNKLQQIKQQEQHLLNQEKELIKQQEQLLLNQENNIYKEQYNYQYQQNNRQDQNIQMYNDWNDQPYLIQDEYQNQYEQYEENYQQMRQQQYN